MRKQATKIIFTIAFGLIMSSVHGQLVKGYFPYYRSSADVANIQYNRLTDIIYAFAAIDANGNLQIMGPGGTPDLSLFNQLKTSCASNGVRLWVAIGGWGLSGNFPGVAADPTRRTTFANACLNLCTTHGLAGIDIDWEFPAVSDRTNFTAMLAQIKSTLGTTYKLSAALGGESFNFSCVAAGHAVGVEAAAFTHLDFFNIMSYDAPSCFANHTSLDFTQRAMDGWNAIGCPYNKMIVGMAFYCRGSMVEMWKNFATTARFNDLDGIDGSIHFDSKPTIEAKTNMAMCVKGAAGIMTWELSQDLPGSNPLNLTSVMRSAADACGCPFSDPALGVDQSLCGVSSINLNSGIATSAGRTFTWTRNGSAFPGSGPTNTVTTAGTYRVTITEGTCTKFDEIIITATLPTPALGADALICDPAFYNLAPSNIASFPGGTTYQWRKDGSDIVGATATTLSNVRVAGLYRLTASITGCASTFDEVTLTSSLPTPVDGCNSAAPIGLSITNATGGPYTWYNVATGGTSLATGTSYNAPSAGTYYVQDGASSPPYYVGLNTTANSFQNPTGTSIGLTFTTSAAVTINSVDVFLPIGASGNVQIRIRNSANTADVFTGPLTAVTNSTGAIRRVTIPVGAALTAGSYRMVDVGSVNLHVNSAPTYPLTNNDVSITGSFGLGSYAFFFNWEIAGSGSACKRLPVVASLSGSCTAAPVELVYFSAQSLEGKVIVRWSTSQEINNHYFLVQRSTDGVNFVTIARVEGYGNTQELKSYIHHDIENAADGIIYYKLLQIDFDGTVHESGIVSVANRVGQAQVNPNPFAEQTTVLAGMPQEKVQLLVLDVHGRVVESSKVEGGNMVSIGQNYLPGVYMVQINYGYTVETIRIVKQ